MPQPITVISHIWNEAFLLPYFIRHYLPIVDRALVFDYGSVDGSVEIIRDMAPDWEVRPSRNELFDAIACDAEVMAAEEEFSGWKFVANITEFLVHKDLRYFLRNLSASAVWSYHISFVDLPEHVSDHITDEPLYFQKRYGNRGSGNLRGRMIHRERNGQYGPGRHDSQLAERSTPDESLFLCYFVLCPLKHLWHRRLATQTMVPKSDIDRGWGVHHVTSGLDLKAFYLESVMSSYDTWERHPTYRRTLESLSRAGAGQMVAPLETFDSEYYLKVNPDVAVDVPAAWPSARAHFVAFGRREGRLPRAPG
jgi:hypothetical protein